MCPALEQRPLQVNIDSSSKRTPYSVDEWSVTGSGFFTPSEEISIVVGSGVYPRHVLNMAQRTPYSMNGQLQVPASLLPRR